MAEVWVHVPPDKCVDVWTCTSWCSVVEVDEEREEWKESWKRGVTSLRLCPSIRSQGPIYANYSCHYALSDWYNGQHIRHGTGRPKLSGWPLNISQSYSENNMVRETVPLKIILSYSFLTFQTDSKRQCRKEAPRFWHKPAKVAF